MNYLPADRQLTEYLDSQADEEPALLRALSRETHLKMLQARMLSGRYQGRLLSLISKLFRPKAVLEVGTFTGYSALCLAEGLAPNGKLYTVEVNPEALVIANEYFSRSDLGRQIVVMLGDAHQILPTLDTRFDLVYVDADKKSNEQYVMQILPKLKRTGLILLDNVLWSGKVHAGDQDPDTRMIREMNERLSHHPDLETLILPVRDGIMLLKKR